MEINISFFTQVREKVWRELGMYVSVCMYINMYVCGDLVLTHSFIPIPHPVKGVKRREKETLVHNTWIRIPPHYICMYLCCRPIYVSLLYSFSISREGERERKVRDSIQCIEEAMHIICIISLTLKLSKRDEAR